MRLATLYTCCAFIAAIPAMASAEDRKPDAAATPERILPLLESRCIACHGPDAQEGGLRLDSRGAALKGGKHGPALKPGQPKESLLLQAALHEKNELAMPPKEKLSAGELNALETWIRSGAPCPGAVVAQCP